MLHGASGIGDEDIRHAISLGITKINIHTELCEAAMSAIEAHEKGEGYQALNIRVRDAVQKRAEEKILLFGSNGKAEGWFENNECCEVVIVGAAHTDLQLYPVGADVLDTASYSVKQMVLTVGGDALNEATVITRLGHKVRLVSCVGDDVIGSLVLEHCRKNNIGTEYIKVDSSKVTSINVGLIREDGERTFINNKSGSIWTFCPEDVERESVSHGRILSFASIFNNPLLDESLMIPLFERAREKGMLICADIVGCKRGERLEDIQRALSYVDYFSLITRRRQRLPAKGSGRDSRDPAGLRSQECNH